MDRKACRAALKANLDWFAHSGIMDPPDGSWGVAERVLLTDGNPAVEQVTRSFPAWSTHTGHMLIEQRRSDCNFQVAWLMTLAADAGCRGADAKARRLLEFLYGRSGLLNRSNPAYPDGVWNWSHIRWSGIFWLDDNGWTALLQLWLARLRPEWDSCFGMTQWGLRLTGELNRVMMRYADTDDGYVASDPERVFNGDLRQPHWGMPAVVALLAGVQLTGDRAWLATAERYLRYLIRAREEFNNSESAYAVLALSVAARLFPGEPLWLRGALAYGEQLVRRMAENGGIPAAQHREAPQGEFLLDTIYTANWLLLGLQSLASLTPSGPETRENYDRLLALLLKIQDRAPEPWLHGCWRGMYDCRRHCWGGGDHYEGGANSIYSGWTNAPIAAVLAMELTGDSMAQALERLFFTSDKAASAGQQPSAGVFTTARG